MQKSYLYCTIVLAALLLAGVYGCKKVNGIDNSQVIETPYSLFFSDTAGTLFKSNDGIKYSILFNPDGFEARSIITSNENILWAKRNIYLSINNGTNFNHAYDSLRAISRVACNGLAINLNQSCMIDIPDWNMIFSVTNIVNNPTSTATSDWMGVCFSNNHGIRGSWATDGSYDTTGRTGILPVQMTSYTRLVNGVLCGLALDQDQVHQRNFYLTCGTCGWDEVTAGAHGPKYTDSSGISLPPNYAIPDTGFFTLGHLNNRLIAIDEHCYNGGWYSDDTGRTWYKYTGLPANTPLLCISSPFEEIALVGTYGAGLYMLNPNTPGNWQPNNNGLASNLIIRSITAKENIYKNGVHKRYIYLATSNGIYQSTDDGINWIRTIPGNYVAIY